jgi:alkylation response protein AidB-like acyl-CoA dehydrogenase
MDFTPSPDELALAAAVREFCERRYGGDAITSGVPADAALWSDLADLGVFALRLPEDEGGAGLGLVEAAMAFEELGRALIPGPLVASHLAAGIVDGAATGETIVGWLDLSGDPLVLEHAGLVGTVLVDSGTGVGSVDRSAIEGEPAAMPIDPPTTLLRVTAPVPGGSPVADAERLRLIGALLTAAYQVGIAAAVTERAVGYVKEREQFGRAIGSFQAVKHLLADMLVRSELARAAVHAAALALDDPEGDDPERAVAGAKLLADEAALLDCRGSIQAHGGMGFTWELPLHRYFKRAWVLSTTYGTAEVHATTLAASA